jgi:hypothetical protein
MSLRADTMIYRSQAKTKYLAIPSAIAQDSTFPFDVEKDATIYIIPNKGLLIVRRGELMDIKEDKEGAITISHAGFAPNTK